MLFASSDPMSTLFLTAIFWVWVANRFLGKHPEVKDAAGKAASKKAIDLIQRFLR